MTTLLCYGCAIMGVILSVLLGIVIWLLFLARDVDKLTGGHS